MSKQLEKSTVLLIDDVVDSIEILNQILCEEYRVLFATTGPMGLLVAREQGPDIILLDVSMPGMDGYQVCRELKADPATWDIPVIFITAKDQDDDQEMGFRIGGADYLTKPVRPAMVRVRVKNQLLLRRSEELIIQQALYDGLTQLPNRNLTIDRLRFSITQGHRNQTKMALLFVDLDNFKSINDSLGHDTGDLVLLATADCLRSCVREGDTVGRLGGDEFLVILPGLRHVDDAKKVAEIILQTFSRPLMVSGIEVVVTASIGIAISPEDGMDYKSLLANSDTAMYQSKRAGKNSYHLYNEEMNQGLKHRMHVKSQLHHALERGELSIHYQPIIAVGNRRIIGVEALVRWNNPELGEVSPDEFIMLAEQSGMIDEIGYFVLMEGCRQLNAVQNSHGEPLKLAVNISPHQFRDGKLPQLIDRILDESGFAANRLELEVTEGLLLDIQRDALESLLALRKMGVLLSMDDFGTGYSSLSYLRRFPFDIVKIDRSFIKEMEHSAEDGAVVNAAIAMAHGLGLQVVAEGVETEGQLSMLAGKGCDLAQGYLISRAMPDKKLAKWLAQYPYPTDTRQITTAASGKG